VFHRLLDEDVGQGLEVLDKALVLFLVALLLDEQPEELRLPATGPGDVGRLLRHPDDRLKKALQVGQHFALSATRNSRFIVSI